MRGFKAKKAGQNKGCLSSLLAVARGEVPADLALRNARVLDLVTGDIHCTDIAISGTTIAAVSTGLPARHDLDLNGLYVCPGLIDAHVHIESTMLRPLEFGRLIAPHGVTTVISNPHEIANVCGVPGIRFMCEDACFSPVDILMTIPSCVPATSLAGTGASLESADLRRVLRYHGVVGLGEVMDFQGVIQGKPRLMHELGLAAGYPVDGHAPGLKGAELDAYVAAGISSDHECSTQKEVLDRLRRGMHVFLREGSAARNLQALLPVISAKTEHWLAFCTDDREAADLLQEGSIDHLVRKAVLAGVPLVTALRMACLNPAEHYRLTDRGLIAPGRRADMVAFSSLDDFRPRMVWQAGRLVARDGEALDRCTEPNHTPSISALLDTVHVDWERVDLRIPAMGRRVRVIGVLEGQLVTEQRVLSGKLWHGELLADPDRDLLKLAVIERHHTTGRCGLGLVQGLRLQRGAVASTVAHDHHNVIVAGVDDRSMLTAARAVADSGGGQAVALADRVLEHLPLPLGGLMTQEPAGELIRIQSRLKAAVQRLGCGKAQLFMTLSFLGLEVIPELKLTDYGLIDVTTQKVVPLFVDA
ncbi:MAG: adenine deaminase [Pedobacter sp.]